GLGQVRYRSEGRGSAAQAGRSAIDAPESFGGSIQPQVPSRNAREPGVRAYRREERTETPALEREGQPEGHWLVQWRTADRPKCYDAGSGFFPRSKTGPSRRRRNALGGNL